MRILLYKLEILFLRIVLFIIRGLRFLVRLLKQFLQFIPFIIILILLSYLIYVIGFKVGWYEAGYISALRNFVGSFIGIFMTTFVIAFMSKERKRKTNLNQQYISFYRFCNASLTFVDAIDEIFNFSLDLNFYFFTKKENNYDEIEKIRSITINTNNNFWITEIPPRFKIGKSYKKYELLNRNLNDMVSAFDYVTTQCNVDMWDVFKHINRLKFAFSNEVSSDEFAWTKLYSDEVKYKILRLLSVINETFQVLGKPWRRDIEIDERIYSIEKNIRAKSA